MTNILDMLQGQMSDSVVEQLSRQLGGADREQVRAASTGIMTTLLRQLARNASTTDGARSLDHALQRDHDGSLLDNLGSLLGGQVDERQRRMVDGAGILRHVLGGRQGNVVDMISGLSGLDRSKTGSLMTMLAPILMGALGRAKRERHVDSGSIGDLLNGTVREAQDRNPNNPFMDMIGSVLDRDGDGNAMDDVAGMLGRSLLRNFFNR